LINIISTQEIKKTKTNHAHNIDCLRVFHFAQIFK